MRFWWPGQWRPDPAARCGCGMAEIGWQAHVHRESSYCRARACPCWGFRRGPEVLRAVLRPDGGRFVPDDIHTHVLHARGRTRQTLAAQLPSCKTDAPGHAALLHCLASLLPFKTQAAAEEAEAGHDTCSRSTALVSFLTDEPLSHPLARSDTTSAQRGAALALAGKALQSCPAAKAITQSHGRGHGWSEFAGGLVIVPHKAPPHTGSWTIQKKSSAGADGTLLGAYTVYTYCCASAGGGS